MLVVRLMCNAKECSRVVVTLESRPSRGKVESNVFVITLIATELNRATLRRGDHTKVSSTTCICVPVLTSIRLCISDKVNRAITLLNESRGLLTTVVAEVAVSNSEGVRRFSVIRIKGQALTRGADYDMASRGPPILSIEMSKVRLAALELYFQGGFSEGEDIILRKAELGQIGAAGGPQFTGCDGVALLDRNYLVDRAR